MQHREQMTRGVPSALQLLIDDIVHADSKTPGAAIHVEAPDLGLSWGGAAGVTDFASATSLTPHHPLRVASNTKTFVAAAILRLWEEGRLELDVPVTAYPPVDYIEMMQHGRYRPDSITVRHLLTHTSGLFDYGDSEAFGQRIEADLTHRWTRAEQLQGAMDWGRPYGTPGEVYRYADTGYILLGEILERLTDLSLAAALRQLINYDGLGLTSTWLESMEPAFANGTSTEEFEAVMGSLFAWYEEAEARGMPIAIDMMLSLTDEQLARLPARLEEDNEELSEDEAGLSVEQSQKRWREEFAEGFARFAGKLNQEQKDYLVQQSVRYVPQYDLWADYRRRWYLDVMALLRDGRDDPEAFAQAFLELAANRRSHYYGLELTVIFDHNEVLYRDVSVWLINHLSEKQREKLFTRTGELAVAFRELVAQAPEQAPTESVCLVRC